MLEGKVRNVLTKGAGDPELARGLTGRTPVIRSWVSYAEGGDEQHKPAILLSFLPRLGQYECKQLSQQRFGSGAAIDS